jgi:predicted benzoate:H+ symporter BenE
MSDDDTQIGIDKLIDGKKLTDTEKTQLRQALARNSRVSKAIIWIVITISGGILAAMGAQLTGLINIIGN